ncbi:formylglycine-generating enzyme family protein, partial [bacterium]|nr:formylglycine-generating enzyme family protein [bacterium]
SHENSSGSVAAYAFTPELVGKNFKHAYKGADLQVKFSANAKGKATAAFKFLPNSASPAFVGGYVPPAPPAVTNRLYMVIDLSGGTNATSFAISYLDDVPEGGWTEEYKTTKLVLRRIEPGTFVMGCPTNELGRIPIDVGIFETQHQVTLTNAFYIGVFETTQKQYELITGMEPSEYVGATRPVESVSYDMLRGNDKGASWPYGYDVDEDSFFGKLRSKTQMTFDLPTEAQWEYACRAGTTTALNDGSNITNTYSDGSLAKLARYCFNRDDGKGGYGEHTAVGSYQPNAWDLYDMLGNVYEWCRDWFEEDLGTTPATEPYGPSVGSLRVIRGGGWNLLAYSCRSANRYYRGYPHRCSNLSGFRIVLVQSE